MIPDMVFQIEELERQLIQLSSKGAQCLLWHCAMWMDVHLRIWCL